MKGGGGGGLGEWVSQNPHIFYEKRGDKNCLTTTQQEINILPCF